MNYYDLFWFESLKEEAQQGSTSAHSPQLVLLPLTCSDCFHCWDWNSYTNTCEFFMHNPHSGIHVYLLQWHTCTHGTYWIVPQVSCVCVCVCVLFAFVQWLCGVVAGLLHYFFLCVFCWMLAEGIMLYLLLIRVFGSSVERWYLFLPIGWSKSILSSSGNIIL